MMVYLQLLIYGLQLGSIYAMLAIGYTMVYGMVSMINFAHGDFLMIGAFVMYFFITLFTDIPSVPVLVLLILITMILTGGIGVAVERIAYKPLRSKARMSSLITALGVSVFLENFPRAIPAIGPNPRHFPEIIPAISLDPTGNLNLTTRQITIFFVLIVMMLLLYFFTSKHPLGKQMRAVAQDKDASALMGININGIISLTFFIGAAFAAVGGVMYGCVYPMITVTMGSWMGTKAFVCAVFGGIGDIRGAMLGGLLMGIIEIFAMFINSNIGYGISFLVLIIVLLVRPEGLLGKTTIEKV